MSKDCFFRLFRSKINSQCRQTTIIIITVTYTCNQGRSFSGNAGRLVEILAVVGYRIFLVFKILSPSFLNRGRILQVHFVHLFGIKRGSSIQKSLQWRWDVFFFDLGREKGRGKSFVVGLRHPQGGGEEASL